MSGDLFDLLGGSCPFPLNQPIEQRRLYVAARFARVDRSVINNLDRQPYSDPSLTWMGCVDKNGFCGDLGDWINGYLPFSDPVVLQAIRLRCLVYGEASDDDFEHLPEEDYQRFQWRDGWSLYVDSKVIEQEGRR